MPNSADFNRFAVNPLSVDISRSLFNMNPTHKFSANVGDCIPVFCEEVLPGDTWTVDTTKVVRMQPMVTPVMDEILFDQYWFFVPNRLVYSHWQEFMGENTESSWAPQVEYSIPQLEVPDGGFAVGSIADYLGIPPNSRNAGCSVNALPFRGYALIMDQWFRSESLQDPVHVHVDEVDRTGVTTGDQVTDIELGGKPFVAGKLPDYFTSCLPSPQRGEPVTFELAGLAPVNSYNKQTLTHGVTIPSDMAPLRFNYGNANNKFDYKTGYNYLVNYPGSSSNKFETLNQSSDPGGTQPLNENGSLYPSNLWADLGSITTFNVNDLRTAFAVQRYLEKSARYGGRYIEMIKAFFNVDSPDARMQRAEYLGGSRMPLNVNSIQQTSATVSGSTPQGNPTGLSVTAHVHSDFTKSFTEHGFLFCIAVARYHHSYSQGIRRFWTYKDKYEIYLPTFASLGEMPVKKDEIFFTSRDSSDSNTFGFQEAWAWYRSIPNRVSGEMRPDVSNSLAMWHFGDNYVSQPSLSASWLREDKSPVDRTLAVTSAVSNQYFADMLFNCKVARPMPLYSIPGLIDHH